MAFNATFNNISVTSSWRSVVDVYMNGRSFTWSIDELIVPLLSLSDINVIQCIYEDCFHIKFCTVIVQSVITTLYYENHIVSKNIYMYIYIYILVWVDMFPHQSDILVPGCSTDWSLIVVQTGHNKHLIDASRTQAYSEPDFVCLAF